MIETSGAKIRQNFQNFLQSNRHRDRPYSDRPAWRGGEEGRGDGGGRRAAGLRRSRSSGAFAGLHGLDEAAGARRRPAATTNRIEDERGGRGPAAAGGGPMTLDVYRKWIVQAMRRGRWWQLHFSLCFIKDFIYIFLFQFHVHFPILISCTFSYFNFICI